MYEEDVSAALIFFVFGVYAGCRKPEVSWQGMLF